MMLSRRGICLLSQSAACLRQSSTLSRRALLNPSLLSPSQSAVSRSLSRTLTTSAKWRQSVAAAGSSETVDTEESPAVASAQHNGPVTSFDQLAERGLVCPTVVDTITKGMGLTTMTEVQSLTIHDCLQGNDVIAQARTGTGKTLAFLVPILQKIINHDPYLEHHSRGQRAASTDIRAIVISPTRELAEQIAVEARKLTRNTNVVVQTAVGGTQKRAGLMQMHRQGCHILVATPGRLQDLLSDPYSDVRAPRLSALVLDEADRLLDQGFAPEIDKIMQLLPDQASVDRQTLLYSATVPREVKQLVRDTLKPNFKFIKTVREGEAPTHERVTQKLVTVNGFQNLHPALAELCQREIEASSADRPFKALVFFNATADVALAAAIMQGLQSRPAYGRPEQTSPSSALLPHSIPIIEIHSRLSQAQRTRAADRFRRARSGILLSSDVTARGMDFPAVTHVVQVGLPNSRESYIHRIGRTARANNSGEGWLFVTPLESDQLRQRLSQLPLQQDTSLSTPTIDMTSESQIPESAATILSKIRRSVTSVPPAMLRQSYLANIGVFSWYPRAQTLIDSLNELAQFGWGLQEPPAVPSGIMRKMGLARVRGLNVSDERDDDRFSGRGNGYAPRGGRGVGLDRDRYARRDTIGAFSSSGNSRGGGRGGGGYGGRGSGRGGYGGGDRYAGGERVERRRKAYDDMGGDGADI